MKTPALALLFALLATAAAQAPRLHLQLRAEETVAVLSQSYSGGGAAPTGGEGFTNFARRYDLHLGGLLEKGLLRVGLGLRAGLVAQEFYSSVGSLLKNTNSLGATFAALPEAGLRLGPLYGGVGFHWVPVPETDPIFARTESFEHLLPNAPIVRLALDLRLGKSAVSLLAGGLWSRPLEGGWTNQNLGLDGGIRLDLNYYIGVELRYRAWLGLRENHQYAAIQFQYRFTPSWSASAHWSRLLYLPGASPQNRLGLGAAWSSKRPGG